MNVETVLAGSKARKTHVDLDGGRFRFLRERDGARHGRVATKNCDCLDHDL
jgi:hypothetical protein